MNDELSYSGVIERVEPMARHRTPDGGCLSTIALGLGASMMWVSVNVLAAIFVYRVILPLTFMKPILDMFTKG